MTKGSNAAEVEIVEVKDLGLKNPLIIAGFVGAGLVGSIAVDQIITQLKMEEVAYIKSKHLPPVAIFVGEKLRHPFRIHASKKDNLCVVICEIPLKEEGLYSISSALLDWAEKQGTKEILVLEGIPVPGLPTDRQPFCVTELGRCEHFKDRGINLLRKGIIYGIAGAILSECLTRKIEGTAILTPAMATIPDPEGAAVLIEALNRTHGLKIDTADLIAGANEIREKLREIAENYEKTTTTEPEKMYA
ncbi:MAG: proteasome assembly chaperone family protein [Candidatus Hadarchaeum sp.]